MKRDTRREILETARRLFNERGFNAVSTRDIADALGISKGNLTYHFKKKEEMVEAILAESERPPQSQPRSLEELDAFFRNLQRVVQENAYYFWHHAQLSQLSPLIREKQNLRYRTNAGYLAEAFRTLHQRGELRDENFPGEYDRIIDALLLSNIYWKPFGDLKGPGEEQGSFRLHAWAVMHHLLTAEGRAALGGIFPE